MARVSDTTIQTSAWLLAATVATLAFVKWGSDHLWHFNNLNAYKVFPLLGLLAFSLMWTHYFVGTVRDGLGVKPEVLKPYYKYTGYAVLLLICLHPGLLIYQRYIDGAGLPPGSYESYVAPGLGWVTIVGTASLLVFLAFELHRKFGDRSWWHYVVDASDVAMLAIVYHSLRLGTQLQTGWFKYVWWFYAIVLVAVLIRKYSLRLTRRGAKAGSKV